MKILKVKSKKNISYHYDLGNDFYKHWLDQINDLFFSYFS